MEENYFDVDAALKEHSAEKVAEHLAKIHGVDREAYLKDGMTDSQFLNEFKLKPLPAAETQEETVPKSHLEQPNIAVNVLGGGAAAAVPAVASYGANKILSGTQHALGLKPGVAAPSAPPVEVQKQFVSPEAIEQRILESGKPPRPQGPGDVVNWALGKTPESGQYGRGYLGGQSQAEEAALHAQADALEKANPGMKIKQGTANLLIPEAEYNRLAEEKRIADLEAKNELSTKAKQAAELRANRLAEVEPSTGNKIVKGVTNIAKAPVPNRFALGYNAMDALQAQNPFEAGVSTAGALSPYVVPKIAKMLPKKYRNIVEGVGSALPYAAPAINALERKLIAPKEEKAAGGLTSLSSGGSPQQKAAGGAIQHFQKGKLVEEAAKAALKKLNLADFEGKTLLGTLADRTKVGDGLKGGPMFPTIYPGAAWAMNAPGAASRLVNAMQAAGGPESTIVAPMLMKNTAHKSNRDVADMAVNQFKQNYEAGLFTPERLAEIENNIRKVPGLEKHPGLLHPEAEDLLHNMTFNQRGKLVNWLGSKAKTNPAMDLQKLLRETAEPGLFDEPLGAVGPSVFKLSGEQSYKPGLHNSYDYIVHGEPVGAINPIPREFLFRDLETKARKELGRSLSDYNYRTSVGVPSQLIDDKLLKSLDELGYLKPEGFAPGGKVMKAAVEEFKKKFTPGFYHGSPSNKIEVFDPNKSMKDPMMAVRNATFVSRNPNFAESFLVNPEKEKVVSGATMYPVSVNLGKHFDAATPEGSETIKQYLLNKYKKEPGFDDVLNQKHEHYMDRLTDPLNNWNLLESPDLLNYLKSTGYDTFSVTEGGVKNVGIFDPKHIRGKFAKYNPEDAESPDFMKAQGGLAKIKKK